MSYDDIHTKKPRINNNKSTYCCCLDAQKCGKWFIYYAKYKFRKWKVICHILKGKWAQQKETHNILNHFHTSIVVSFCLKTRTQYPFMCLKSLITLITFMYNLFFIIVFYLDNLYNEVNMQMTNDCKQFLYFFLTNLEL